MPWLLWAAIYQKKQKGCWNRPREVSSCFSPLGNLGCSHQDTKIPGTEQGCSPALKVWWFQLKTTQCPPPCCLLSSATRPLCIINYALLIGQVFSHRLERVQSPVNFPHPHSDASTSGFCAWSISWFCSTAALEGSDKRQSPRSPAQSAHWWQGQECSVCAALCCREQFNH